MAKSIQFIDVAKQYRLGEVGTGTLSHDLHRAWARLRGKPDPFALVGTKNDRTEAGGEYVWALRDINFAVNQGEILGIIGRNGAGKSTLLKLLSRVTAPTTGCIQAKGRIASLLEVGTGFHPELTGRENIYLNGAILGMRRREIRQRLAEIVDFSGCEKYIDTPVKRYSSGMRVRLGFAVAAHLDCEILVVDEVLAVGDAEFQGKCIGKMKSVSSTGGRTVLFVSHNMGSIRALCNKAVILDNGTCSEVQSVESAVDSYFSRQSHSGVESHWKNPVPDANRALDVSEVSLNNSRDYQVGLNESDPLNIVIEFIVTETLPVFRIGWLLQTKEGVTLAEAYQTDAVDLRKRVPPGVYRLTTMIPPRLLRKGRYHLSVNAGIPNVKNLWHKDDVVAFTIKETEGGGSQTVPRLGYIQPNFDWELESC